MKKLLIIPITIVILYLFGCGTVNSSSQIEEMDPFAEKEEVFINIGDNENIPLTTLTNFIEIGNTSKMGAVITTLYYDKFTKIVYFDGYYVFEPYCAPNGLPYKYNPETNTLEEIELD